MEINSYEEITGVVVTADVVDGKFGVFTSHSWSNDFGSMTDLPGFKVPATAEEAKNAAQLITWAVDNRPYPAVLPLPAYSFSLRNGFGSAANTPFSATMHITNPAYHLNMTIPSGSMALAFGKGTYTLPSGQFVYAAGLRTPGALVQVCNTNEDTTDAGKLKLLASMSDRKVGTVRYFNTTTAALTVDID
jgi:hypothetical protein